MAFYTLFRPKGRTLAARRRRRKTEAGSALLNFLETNRIVAVGVFFLTVAAMFTTTFVGVNPAGFQVLEGQTATVRITADSEFSFESPLLTQRKEARLLNEVPAVFRVDRAPEAEFEGELRQLMAELDQLDDRWAGMSDAERLSEATSVADAFSRRSGFQVTARDLVTLMNAGDDATRNRLLENGLFILREIHRAGIFDPESTLIPQGERELRVFQIKLEGGETAASRIQSLEDALQNLRINLTGENVSALVSTALYRVLRTGVRDNIRRDEAATRALRDRVLANIKPEVRRVEAGEVIIEQGARVTPEQYEVLMAYQRQLNEQSRLPTGIDERVISRILLVIGLIIAAAIYVRVEDPMALTSNGRLALLAVVLAVSLGLIRLFFEAGTWAVFADYREDAALLPYVAPVVFAPLVIAVLIGASPALFCGLLISVFAAIMFGNRLDILVLSLLTTSVAAFTCRAVRRRSQVVKAGLLSGATMGAFVLALGFAEKIDPILALKATAGAQVTGLVTGIVVVGLLPLLEGLFKRTTDITLLELSDFNHPLLRRMQMDAPGTYHHSLMVANLSENAAIAVGANALLCRVCSMFHDIGKLVKPEYFTENQRDGVNPHEGRSPCLSALIIKSHVKEGLDMAIKHKLPRPVIDVIRQHHGTTLIRYFYEAARKRRKEAQVAGGDESNFRYDGPRPQFKESAIILFADSIEAASRSLQKVTPQAVEELVETIVKDKIEDGQADDAPLTIQEIALIKKSFTHTLLNSLHSRIVYPRGDKDAAREERGRPAERERRRDDGAIQAGGTAEAGRGEPGGSAVVRS